MSNESEQIARFEQMGKEEVHRALTANRFSLVVEGLAIKWLAQKDQEAERRNEASQAEQMTIARSAKDAAWEAARAANIANKIAAAALIAAAVAIIVSIISLVRSH